MNSFSFHLFPESCLNWVLSFCWLAQWHHWLIVMCTGPSHFPYCILHKEARHLAYTYTMCTVSICCTCKSRNWSDCMREKLLCLLSYCEDDCMRDLSAARLLVSHSYWPRTGVFPVQTADQKVDISSVLQVATMWCFMNAPCWVCLINPKWEVAGVYVS